LKRLFSFGNVPPIHVIDDDEDMLFALKDLLQSAGYVAHTYENAMEFMERTSEFTGVLLLDLRLRGMGGLSVQERLSHYPHLQIIFMSGVAEVPDSVVAMKAGAHDFLVKPFRDQVLLDSVATAMMKVAASVAESQSFEAAVSSFETLTETEREIARLVASGLRNKEIAYISTKTENTVKVHRSRIMRKMGVNSAYALMSKLQVLGPEQEDA